ncbi:CTP synthase [Bienertia sinuspersici]
MAVTCWYGEGSKEVEVAEVLAARHGLSIAIKARLTSIILKTDCIKLYQHLKKGKREASYFGKIVQDILHLAKRCNCISAHIKRSGNRVAHDLAKLSKGYSEMMVWLEEVPPSMHDYVMDDVLFSNS